MLKNTAVFPLLRMVAQRMKNDLIGSPKVQGGIGLKQGFGATIEINQR